MAFIGALALTGLPSTAAELTPAEIAALRPILTESQTHGLGRPGDKALSEQLAEPDPQVRAAAGQALRDRAIVYALDQHAGRAAPATIDRRWAFSPPALDAEAAFEQARASGRLQAWVASLPPQHREYAALRAARSRYARIVDAGGWVTLEISGSLAAGAEGLEVDRLRSRLAAEGYVSADENAVVFGPSLAVALKAFQSSHGLSADGVVGPLTLVALNTSVETRLAQIDLALERWRWLPRTLPPRRVEVNVAAAEAAFYDRHAEVLRMRIVVGDLSHKTPLFRSTIHSVVFNPPWNVPTSIAQNEILPRARRDPGYLARNRFRYVGGQLQQAPGAGNALGRLKLDFDSPFGVYLHDTPGKAAFARTQRTLSHGCMRMEKPRELAGLLLGWSPTAVDAVIDAGATRRVRLTIETPVFVLYQTAWVQLDGRVAFRPDVYDWDAKLSAALQARPAVAVLDSAVEIQQDRMRDLTSIASPRLIR
jgi:L,D-transpeptidase YcbB